MIRFIDAAAVLLLKHYDMEEARYRAQVLAERSEQNPLDTMLLACTMAMQDAPWWDSDDPKVRATKQLEINTLLLPSLDSVIEDVEAALGRELEGADLQEKKGRLASNVPKLLAELKGEEYVDPLQSLLEILKQGVPPIDVTSEYEEEEEDDEIIDAEYEEGFRDEDSE